MRMRTLISAVAAAMVLAAGATTALAQGQRVCVRAGAPILASTTRCPKHYRSKMLATESDVSTLQREVRTLKRTVSGLQNKLSRVSYSPAGLNGLPTLKIDGANLQIVSGSGSTDGTVNGLGNLIIGYDENPYDKSQNGSHNLVLGNNQTFTSYGGLIGGQYDVLSGPFSVVFGFANTAGGEESAVSGGAGNKASGTWSSVSGGIYDTASATYSWVSGGEFNTASYKGSSVSGGGLNNASGADSSVSGGVRNTASGQNSSILGGLNNVVSTGGGTYPAGP